jgi:hypothetical protein
MTGRLTTPPATDHQHATAVLVGALRARRDAISPEPADDPLLDARILGEARRTSAQISANRGIAISGRAPSAGRDVGWLLWTGWLAALGAAAALWWWWH